MTLKTTPPFFSGPKHFDGKRFYNPGAPLRGFRDFLQWRKYRKPQKWPRWIETAYAKAPVTRVFHDALVITVINHATVLIQTAGKNILTDPVWSYRIGPTSWLGVKRIKAPGITLDQLPPIDYILISHDHYDHLDLPTVKYLVKRDNSAVFCGLGVEKYLRFANTTHMDWWQEASLTPDLRLIFTPAQHFSGRMLHDRNATLWGSFVIQAPGGPIYFAGDTGFSDHFDKIYQTYGPMRVSLLPIGAYEPRWFMGSVHIDPFEAVKAHQILKSELSIAIHFGTFPLADEGYETPLEDLAKALQDASIDPASFQVPRFGESLNIPPSLSTLSASVS